MRARRHAWPVFASAERTTAPARRGPLRRSHRPSRPAHAATQALIAGASAAPSRGHTHPAAPRAGRLPARHHGRRRPALASSIRSPTMTGSVTLKSASRARRSVAEIPTMPLSTRMIFESDHSMSDATSCWVREHSSRARLSAAQRRRRPATVLNPVAMARPILHCGCIMRTVHLQRGYLRYRPDMPRP